jgi:periplasmic divalent cation tolerance protein
MGMNDASLIYATCGSRDEAVRLGRALVEARLVACASVIDGLCSVYWWEGRVQDSAEALLLCKTHPDRVDAAIDRLRALHSYDCPCILALPVSAGLPDFLAWIAAETGIG